MTQGSKSLFAFDGRCKVSLAYGYARSVSSLNRMMRKLGIGRKKQRKKRHVPKPYETPKVAGERV